MVVQEIKPLDKRRSRIVFEDGESLVLYNGEIRRFGIETEGELSEEVYHLQIVPKLKKRVRERIVFILRSTDKTEKELSEKLRSGGYSKEIADYGISWAKQHNFINDSRYLSIYVDSKVKKTSRQKLRFDLKAKGFSEEEIADALENAEIDEEAQILDLLRKKGYFAKEFLPENAQKLLASIVRKGYSYAKVLRCMKMEEPF